MHVTTATRHGEWGPVLKFPNVPIHAHVLPNGRVLMWGRRDRTSNDPASLHQHFCDPFVWDPADPTESTHPTTAKTSSTPRPTLADGEPVNVFCGGHTFLPDGRLLVAGGHIKDGEGKNQTSIYDFADGSADGSGNWHPTGLMNAGRWYPTVTTLPDGRVLVLSGSFGPGHVNNDVPQIWSDGAWVSLNNAKQVLDLYPRVHVTSDGQIFVSGPQQQARLLDLTNGGSWQTLESASHKIGQLDYAPAVMYDVDKIIYIGGGGGNEDGEVPPSHDAEIIDLQERPLKWHLTGALKHRRRQHNGTVLPDGTVLVTGGTRGAGFNILDHGGPVHAAELWDPVTEQWTEMAAEEKDRCYHSIAVLLPDATVLSAGGGEFADANGRPNNPNDTHRDGQIFRPPYLFKGVRPEISSAPTTLIHYGETFTVESSQAETISKITLIRLSSVTHAFNQSQHINFLDFSVNLGVLSVTAPSSPNVCVPGHYMLFLLNRDGVPSIARILQIGAGAEVLAALAAARPASATLSIESADQESGSRAAAENFRGPAVVVGLTSTCPYGVGACWGGAHEALSRLDGVDWVNPIADAGDSTAEVFLSHRGLPPLSRWLEQFQAIVNGRYGWRGVEITLHGVVDEGGGSLSLALTQQGTTIPLAPLTAAQKVQFDNTARTVKPMSAGEAGAYDTLAASVPNMQAGQQVTVTGPLVETPSGYLLHVRLYQD